MSQQLSAEKSVRAGEQTFESLPGYAHLIDYLYCLLASTVIVGQPLPGGAMYMAVLVTRLAARLTRPDQWRTLPKATRVSGYILSALSALIALALLLIYPRSVDLPHLWVLFGLILAVKLRDELIGRVNSSCLRRCLRPVQRALRLAYAQLLFILLPVPLLFFTQQTDTAWYLLGGFALTGFVGGYALYTLRAAPPPQPPRENSGLPEALSQVNALKSFATVLAFTTTALQVTMVLSYTLIGTTAGDLLLCMGIAFLCTYIPVRLVNSLMNSRRSVRRDPSNMLLSGLMLWLISLVFLWRNISDHQTVWAYVSLALCTAGTALAGASLQSLSRAMDDIIAFVSGARPDGSAVSPHAARANLAGLFGQMISLIGLGLLLFFSPGSSREVNLQPTLMLPALLLVAAALFAAFRFPLDQKVRGKLHRFLMLKENGETNQPLQRQLEDLIVKVHRRHYGIKLLIIVLRPFFYVRLADQENVVLDRDTACVFVCNHGEMYGPIVTNLYVPFSFRPWSINEMMDKTLTADYLYKYTFIRQRWLPDRLKHPFSRFVTPILNWMMESLDSIPVYRNTPSELIKTLRASAQAMEAGDNLLIFPENPNDPSQEKNGYLQDGIGNFFTGFAAVGQVYAKKTGKCAQFFPIYADKKRRLMRFGKPIRYNPGNPPKDEQQRISDYLRGEMLRMEALNESLGAD